MIDDGQRPRLNRAIGYGCVAVICVWTLIAVLLYATMASLSVWLVSAPFEGVFDEGWTIWTGQLVDQMGGITIALIWFAVSLIIIILMSSLRRIFRRS